MLTNKCGIEEKYGKYLLIILKKLPKNRDLHFIIFQTIMIIWIILFESQGWKRQNADAVRAFSSISEFLPPHSYSLSSYFMSLFTLTVGKSKFTKWLMIDIEKSPFSQVYSHFKGHHLMTNTKYWISNDKTRDSVRQRRKLSPHFSSNIK